MTIKANSDFKLSLSWSWGRALQYNLTGYLSAMYQVNSQTLLRSKRTNCKIYKINIAWYEKLVVLIEHFLFKIFTGKYLLNFYSLTGTHDWNFNQSLWNFQTTMYYWLFCLGLPDYSWTNLKSEHFHKESFKNLFDFKWIFCTIELNSQFHYIWH